jgi:large conductance mechanosensitive channel
MANNHLGKVTGGATGLVKGFRDFILRGNVVDLAVAVVIGTAFTAIVTALVKDIITPLIAAIFKAPDFSKLSVTLNSSKIMYGSFLNALIAFLLVAATVYFFVVLPVNNLMARFKKAPPAVPPTTRPCPECMSDIPMAAKRCAQCGQPVAPMNG